MNFTFGPFQFAAHDPDFSKYFKYVIQKDPNLFPELEIYNEKICKKNTHELLESGKDSCKKGNLKLREFLNPDFINVDLVELINSARLQCFIHAQVEKDSMVSIFKNLLVNYLLPQIETELYSINETDTTKPYKKGFNRFSLKLCIVLVDMRHHGRLNYIQVSRILNNYSDESTRLDSLVNYNSARYKARNDNLKKAINSLEKRSDFKKYFYDADKKDFILINN